MYGGVEDNGSVSSELWAFDVSSKIWENVTVRAEHCNNTGNHTNALHLCGPLKSAGHTATLVTTESRKSDRMIVIFGHSPIYGYLNTVQEFNFGTVCPLYLIACYISFSLMECVCFANSRYEGVAHS